MRKAHEVRLRHGRGRLLDRQGARERLGRRAARGARPAGHAREARPVHQRRPGDDEPVPARRGLRHRRRRRDRPRPRPLRALHHRAHDAPEQLHDRPHLRGGHLEGAARRVPRRDGAGHPAHHRRDQSARARRRRRGRRRHRRDRRHGRRHRVAAVPRGDPPDEDRGGPAERAQHARHARAVHRDRGRAEDEADAALGEGDARDRHPARHPPLPHADAAVAAR